MKLFSIAATAVAMTMAMPAFAATGAVDAPDSVKVEKKDEGQQKICRTLRTTGSRMGDRVCLTKQQWEKVDEDK